MILRNETLKCGGAVVSKTHIVTAAHCMVDIIFPVTQQSKRTPATTYKQSIFDEEFKIVLGATSYQDIKNDRAKNYKIKSVDIHDSYSYVEGFSGYYDIAVITLTSEIEFNNYRIQPICIPQIPYCEQDDLDEKTGAVVGYAESTKLSITYMQISSMSKCNMRLEETAIQDQVEFSFKQGIVETMICAQNDFNNEATCQGDSGE